MKVTSNITLHFPKYDWGIHAGETRDAPKGKKAQDAILSHPAIVESAAGGAKKKGSKTSSNTDDITSE